MDETGLTPEIKRRRTRTIRVGGLTIGGDAPVRVQSMTDTDTSDVEATVSQIHRLEAAGCELVRVAVPNKVAARRLKEIRDRIHIPLVADIHFDYRLALAALEQGVDGLRLNPGNIGSEERVLSVVEAAKEKRVPIRIGVNAGSLPKDIAEKYCHPTAEALVESALRQVALLEEAGFSDIKISLKASDVPTTVAAYRLISEKVDYPLHLGVTEAGPMIPGTVKSAMAMGILLSEGIGDTIRVSLSADPVEEVKVAYEILRGLKLRLKGPEIIACPGCGRAEVDMVEMTTRLEERLSQAGIENHIKVALMGCVVNGPGEAKEADIGIAAGKGRGLLFKKGEVVDRVKEADMVDVLVEQAKDMASRKGDPEGNR